jgi:hypothetical protein
MPAKKEKRSRVSRLAGLIEDLPDIDEDFGDRNPFDTWSPAEVTAYAMLNEWPEVVEHNRKMIREREALGERFLAGDDEAAYLFFFGSRPPSPTPPAPKRERKRPEYPFRTARQRNDGELVQSK